ncbi:BCL-6 corepressor-like protein 1 [Clupea harengus]|uniref:BCL-6 corepressor-like protein 1 n=1 Tax=Clupea harengus TaxID=7950 RepID=A0A6P8GUU0_CLUHA|nr:BCL-6 corepressor-like protein 1 [Clupea harengus]XP_031442934.1 BCL-6 corepressor-like protein 1 [Clupea harengus]XP_031442935.1 BCL-6 corepressor-like protein 1 [Clupea harengus]XP_042566705.1 BCL-6 corepressor-like protein 1 [Clupea harengus]
MQVDPSPMNIGDGGTVSRESRAPTRASGTMVGNPPQTLPPELRGDVPHSQQGKLRTAPDCKTPDACSEATHSNHCSDALPPSQKAHNTPVSGSPAMNSTLHERAECHKAKADGGAGVYPPHSWTGGKKAGVEGPVNASRGGISLNKKSSPPAPSVISLPPGFQCSTLFLSSTNFTSPLCKITLPPGTGQIAALRKATASQFQKVPEGAQQNPQNSQSSGVAPLLHTYPYHFQAGRGPASEKRPPSTKLRCDASSSKNSKLGAEQKTPPASAVSPSITVPIQPQPPSSAHPTRFTISPSAAICCSPALASVTTQTKLLNLMDKGPPYRSVDKTPLAYLKLKSPSATEEHTVGCSVEERDVPLDLSSKSKRQKSNSSDIQNNPALATEHRPVDDGQKHVPNAVKRTQATGFGSAPYSVLPDNQRNGSNPKPPSSKLFNHQTLEPATSWSKHSPQGAINTIPGTYVGVASPILASTLRSKDGKGAAFVEDLQSFAKQETISIVDQGEQLSPLGKESPFAAKNTQHSKSIKHPNSTSSIGAQAYPSKDTLPSGLSPPANSHLHRKSASGKSAPIPYPPAGIKPLWEKPAVLPQGTSIQRKAIQGSPKNKAAASCEGTVFHPPPKLEDEKWGKNNKSPLSNLESIVKQKALETTALTGEAYCGLSSVGSRRTEISSLTGCQNSQLQQPATAGIPPFRPVERRDSKPERTSFPGEPVQTSRRPEKLLAAGQRETSTEKHGKAEESKASKESEVPSKNSRPSQLSSGGSQGSREEMEKDVAEKTAGEKEKDEKLSAQKDPSSQIKALSMLQGQSAIETKVERRTNGTKEGSPFSERSATGKQKKASPKKPGKEKATPERPKKTPPKRPLDKVSPNVKQGSLLKKRKVLPPALDQGCEEKASAPQPEEGAKRRKGKNASAPETPGSASSKAGGERTPATSPRGSSEKQTSHSSPSQPGKETPASLDTPSSRPRRGRRRSEETLRSDWSFAAPVPPLPPPPPPDPPAATPPPPASTPSVPVRRPRGRPRLNPLPEDADLVKVRPAPATETETPSMKKRRRCRNRKYQNGEYITDKHKAVDGEKEERYTSTRQSARMGTDARTGMYPRLSATLTCRSPSPDLSPRRPLFTRSGSVRRQDGQTPTESTDKPAGKRKFKSKHLITDSEDQKKLKTKRGSLVKDEESPVAKKPGGPLASPKGPSSPVPVKRAASGKGGGAPESPPGRPVPPEVRRLIVNKNAGETLLQRAARLGYQDVVLYCLEKDTQEVNRRDNAGYTALHEACARGWTHIVQLLLEHGADVNCSAQDGTRPIHDAVAADNLPAAWILLNHGADPTLATYSGQTVTKLAQSPTMKSFLKEYFTDLEVRTDQDPSLPWEFYSSAVFETDEDPCWDFLLSGPDEEDGGEERREPGRDEDSDADCLMFEFSSEPLLPCYQVQVALAQGFCNWFLLSDVLKRLKMSARIFRARYPHLEVASIPKVELKKQVSISQTNSAPSEAHTDEEDEEREEKEEEEEGDETGVLVDLVRCVPELQGLLGSSLQLLRAEDEDDEEAEEKERVEEERERRKRRSDSSRLCSR